MFRSVMEMANHIMYAIFLAALINNAALIRAQDQSGFISIDCGQPMQNYTDESTGITYISDSNLIDTGESKTVSASLKSNSVSQQLWYVRSFPVGAKNCYTLKPTGDKRYLIRARFMYGNYDLKNQLPEFDVYLGVTFWASIKFQDASTVVDKEIIHVATTDNLYLCVVKTGSSTPFISAIELRLIWKDDIYVTKSGSLMPYLRYDLGSVGSDIVRYRDDPFDRLWYPMQNILAWKTISTDLPIDSTDKNNAYLPPSIVMKTAITPTDPTQALNISWTPDNPKSRFYVYFHFAEVQQLQSNTSRIFNLTLNGDYWYGTNVPDYLYTNTIHDTSSETESQFQFSLIKVNNSTLPPLLNALEAYVVSDIVESQTKQDDALAMWNIKTTYELNMNWQGDPCGPEAFMWEGVSCTNDNPNSSSIMALNLSSLGLTGPITAYVSNLKSLQTLDLSYNNLTSQIPDSLAQLSNLKVLNLSGNNLTGYVPAELLKKQSDKSIFLGLNGNPNLCKTAECPNSGKNQSNSLTIGLGASAGALLIILVAISGGFLFLRARRRSLTQDIGTPTRTRLERRDRQFTYTEVLSMTNNFQVAIGKGGFGTVYLGQIGDAQVAVKMLSPSSVQGYREFQAEAELLMRVHHKNLTSLVGYCDEGTSKGLIYEYMAQGNLRTHLSERNENILSWEKRLQIAVDAAQGLDYLHKGCKPPMIHRDVKSTNILINDQFQAKVSDFGLSMAFPTEGGHLTTTVAGTPGYLDPEYFRTNMLNDKSDVYSFGIVLMEIITCRPVIDKSPVKTHIIDFVEEQLSMGDISKIVDPRLEGKFNENSAWKMVEIARACVAQESTGRPAMSMVVAELEQCLVAARTPGRDLDSSMEMKSMNFKSEFVPRAR